MRKTPWSPADRLLLATPLLAACTENADPATRRTATTATRALTVASSDDACDVSGRRGARRAR